jgi:hypothetical protein
MKLLDRALSFLLVAASLSACAAAAAGPAVGERVPYPEGWRTWNHVGSMELAPGHPLFASFGGLHHVYANDSAADALRSGTGSYADGAVFVFDLHEAVESGGATTAGARKVLGVMHRAAEAYAATGGWGFEGFAGDSRERLVTDGGASCFACHEQEAARSGYVFSTWRP